MQERGSEELGIYSAKIIKAATARYGLGVNEGIYEDE